MTTIRTFALALLAITACSRDNSRAGADSLPDARGLVPAGDTTARPAGDTLPLPADSSGLTGSRITVERAVVNGVLWGSSGDELNRLLGAPRSSRTTWDEALGDSAIVAEYPGLSVRLVEHRVVGLHCTAASCITGDAVRVGASTSEVEQVYGKGKAEGAGILAYPFTTDDSCALRFELRQGRVGAIDVSCHAN